MKRSNRKPDNYPGAVEGKDGGGDGVRRASLTRHASLLRTPPFRTFAPTAITARAIRTLAWDEKEGRKEGGEKRGECKGIQLVDQTSPPDCIILLHGVYNTFDFADPILSPLPPSTEVEVGAAALTARH